MSGVCEQSKPWLLGDVGGRRRQHQHRQHKHCGVSYKSDKIQPVLIKWVCDEADFITEYEFGVRRAGNGEPPGSAKKRVQAV